MIFCVTDYTGNYIYKNGTLEFFNHPEGYVEKEADGYKYVYQYKDHLGNIRLSYKDADKNGAITQSEIVQENNYYPFGLQHKGYNFAVNGRKHNYGYNGKEEQNELGLEWMDFGARNYDAALGRWMNLDPLAEFYHTDTPYAYVLNNPLSFIDPDGRQIIGVTKDDAKKVHEDLNTVFAGEQFTALRSLLTRGKKNNKKTFDEIDGDALKDALSDLEGDDLALAELVTGAINSDAEHKIEFVESSENLSSDGSTAYNDHLTYAISLEMGDKGPKITGQRTGADVSSAGGNGFNVPTDKGSHSFILEGSGVTYGLGGRGATTIHETIGHGIPNSKKVLNQNNNDNAIRAENLVRRVLGIQQQRDGSGHAGGKVKNPSALPAIKN